MKTIAVHRPTFLRLSSTGLGLGCFCRACSPEPLFTSRLEVNWTCTTASRIFSFDKASIQTEKGLGKKAGAGKAR